ncbi:MAG: HEPN domain-containing protein [Chloroflexi bacterium]|nr:HEPN domain-containing protein [Chloroflexota bacterium]
MVTPILDREWRRAQECLGAASLCRDHGFHADAVSRAYYVIMHAAKAALAYCIATRVEAGEDVLPQSHDGVMNRFGLRLVNSGDVDRIWAAVLREMYQKRILADYDVSTSLTENDSREAVERATSFLTRMQLLWGGAQA